MPWQQKLLRWYRKNKRDLPWRRTQDPYAIWVSEIMLQQTTVEAVIPYYERFLKRFPTIISLAEAKEEDVLSLWSGLGYYSRARNLWKAAGMLCGGGVLPPSCGADMGRENCAPTLPHTIKELIQLPGIGRYTAGAIASIAFDQRAPILDGNVIRVLARLFCILEDPKSAQGQKVFWKKAEETLPRKNCGDFNQALMELGATICIPENPLCPACPLSENCRARKKGEASLYPKGQKKIEYRDVLMTAAIIQEEEKILVVQRPGTGLLRGLWEFPMVEGDLGHLLRKWDVEVIHPLPPVRHSVLNRRLKIMPVLCRLKKGSSLGPLQRWVSPKEFSDLPMSSMNRKILEISFKL